MSDLISRLRDADVHSILRALGSDIFGEAADHIEAQDARIRELKAENERLMVDASKHAHDAATVRQRRDAAEAYAQKLREALENIRNQTARA